MGIDPLDEDYLREDLLAANLRELANERGISDEFVRDMIKNRRTQDMSFFRDLLFLQGFPTQPIFGPRPGPARKSQRAISTQIQPVRRRRSSA